MSGADIDLKSAAMTIGAMAFEFEGMLGRFPAINTSSLAKDHPHELIELWTALGRARSAYIDLAEAVRDRQIEARGISLAEEAA